MPNWLKGEHLLLLQPGIEAYAESKSSQVDPLLQELQRKTHAEMDSPQMLCGLIEGRFLKLLVQISQAKRILEIGTFTGYSALSMAEGLPEEGQIISLDINPKHIAMASQFIHRSPYDKKIRIVEGPALDSIAKLDGYFDLVLSMQTSQIMPSITERCFPKYEVAL
jgi:caffeoyl-CoA O-methyltransferase